MIPNILRISVLRKAYVFKLPNTSDSFTILYRALESGNILIRKGETTNPGEERGEQLSCRLISTTIRW